jgi:hypothetical protein
MVNDCSRLHSVGFDCIKKRLMYKANKCLMWYAKVFTFIYKLDGLIMGHWCEIFYQLNLYTWAVTRLRQLVTATQHRGPHSRLGQSMWDLWGTKWNWDRFFSEFFVFPQSVSFHNHFPYSYMNNRQSLTPSTWTIITITYTLSPKKLKFMLMWT